MSRRQHDTINRLLGQIEKLEGQIVRLKADSPNCDKCERLTISQMRDILDYCDNHGIKSGTVAERFPLVEDAVDTGGGKPTCGTCEHWRLTADLGDCTEDADSVAPTLRHKADVCGSHQVRKPSTIAERFPLVDDAVDTKGTNTCER